jgi:hypothetical protein
MVVFLVVYSTSLPCQPAVLVSVACFPNTTAAQMSKVQVVGGGGGGVNACIV